MIKSSLSKLIYCLFVVMALFTWACTSSDDDNIVAEVLIDGGQITHMEGDIQFLDIAPASVELGALEDDSTMFVFAEKKGHELSRDLILDLSRTGDYFPDELSNEEQTWEALNPGIIPAGTIVDSYYFHYDNKTYDDSFDLNNYINCIGQYRVNATVTFRNRVLGIIMRADADERFHLLLSYAELGLPGVDYCEHNFRHFPGINIADGCRSDRFILSEDRRTLTVRNNTDIHHDNYRVVVEGE